MRKSTWFLIFFSIPLFLAPFLLPPRVEAVFPAVPLTAPTSAPTAVLASQSDFWAINGILAEAQILSDEYGSRPPYGGDTYATGARLTRDQAAAALPYIIACESQDKSVRIVDSNGFHSYGILQYQSSTWAGFVKESGLGGDPMVKQDAVRMALWALQHGYLEKWSCAAIEKVIPS